MVIEVPWPAAVPAPVREDLDRLLTDAVRPADRSIRWTGRFRPYGYQLSASGEITPLPVDTKDVDEALSILRESVSLEAHRAVVVCYDTRLREETIDAVAVELSHQDTPPAAPAAAISPSRDPASEQSGTTHLSYTPSAPPAEAVDLRARTRRFRRQTGVSGTKTSSSRRVRPTEGPAYGLLPCDLVNTLEGETRVRSVRPAAVVVLAAGHGKRMRSTIPKALHEIGGRSLLGHVLAAAAPLGADRTVVVVGHGRDEVKAHLAEIAPAAEAVVQAEQRGTGHAVRVALEALEANAGTVVVLNADVPLLRQDTLAGLVAEHASSGRAGTVLTARVEDPTGLGRIVRDGAGELAEIVEESDCDDLQRTIHEINAGIYVFDAAAVRDALSRLSTTNAQGEEYLTDAVAMLVREGRGVGTYAGAAEEALGCNDRIELARLGAARCCATPCCAAGWPPA